MKLKRFTFRLMAAGLIALPLMAHAAGLGNLSVKSALGQPLRAEIELIVADKAELDSLAATIASNQAFQDAKIDVAPVLSSLRFAVVKKPNGKAVLKVTSDRPVNDPFIDMLIELNWASGRLVREYTVLLDPPGTATTQTVKPVVVSPTTPAQATTPRTTIKAAPAPAPVPDGNAAKTATPGSQATPQEPTAKPTREADYSLATPPAQGADTVVVKRGDTLARIAQRVRPEGIALDQALVGLYRENTNAFIGKNINRLKAGRTLKVPTAESFAAIDTKEARREVKLHTDNWQAYRQKLADAAASAQAAPNTVEPGQAASGKITPKVEDKAAPPSASTKDVLKLSKVTPGVTGANNKAADAQAKLRAQEEDATAREKALKESSSRVSALEKQVQDMQVLAKMKEEAAKLEQQKAAEKAAADQAARDKAAADQAAANVLAEAENKAAVDQAAADKAVAPMPPEPEVTPDPIPPMVVPPADVAASVTPWYAAILNNPIYWAAAAALVGLGGLLWWMTSSGRRRKPVTAFEDSILTGGEAPPNTVIGAAAGGSINTGDTSFLTDFSQAGLGTIDTHDVDPIAEAEVYMAYGRDAQAEEILKEAILKNPDRHEIRMKLLEIYAARRNPQAFENVAGELYAALGNKSNNLWDKAAEMGRGIDPTNPLYGDVQSGVPGAKPQARVVETVAATSAIAGGAKAFDTVAEPLEPPKPVEPPKPQPQSLDFEGEPTMPYIAPKPVTPPPPPSNTANELDFDLSDLDVPEPTSKDLDLDLGLNDDSGPDSKFDFSGLDLDLGDGSDAELDEVGTKLDLARAYVEMGDNEGAREILNEVVAEGSDKQKADAKGMLSALA